MSTELISFINLI